MIKHEIYVGDPTRGAILDSTRRGHLSILSGSRCAIRDPKLSNTVKVSLEKVSSYLENQTNHVSHSFIKHPLSIIITRPLFVHVLGSASASTFATVYFMHALDRPTRSDNPYNPCLEAKSQQLIVELYLPLNCRPKQECEDVVIVVQRRMDGADPRPENCCSCPSLRTMRNVSGGHG
jgi:hypothetical protein